MMEEKLDEVLQKISELFASKHASGEEQRRAVCALIEGSAAGLDAQQQHDAWMYAAFNSYADDDTAAALQFASRAAALPLPDGAGVVAHYAVEWLRSKLKTAGAPVYDDSRGFQLFCTAGSNVFLYERTSAMLVEELRACWEQKNSACGDKQAQQPLELLEVGVGEGMAFVPVAERLCGGSAPVLGAATLVEPTAMLDTCVERLGRACSGTGARFEPFRGTLAQLGAQEQAAGRVWDAAEATYALQTIPREQRQAEALPWLFEHVERMLLVVEFDVPAAWAAAPLAPQSVLHVLRCYRRLLLTYAEDNGLRATVACGFLVPVLFGYISRDPTKRVTEEAPIACWVADLRAAGFVDVRVRDVYDYEWAPARLIIAHKPHH